MNPATLRRDLSHLGSFGTRGTGYEVDRLFERVDRALALDRIWPIAIVGAGNLGRALAGSGGFTSGGFRVAALVDVDPALVGTTVSGVAVAHLEDLDAIVEREQVAIGVITTPATAAQRVAAQLVAAGVRSLLNFAPALIALPPEVTVRHVDLAAELQVLTFYGARGGERAGPGADAAAAEGSLTSS